MKLFDNPKIPVTVVVIHPDWTEEVIQSKTSEPFRNLWQNYSPRTMFGWSEITAEGEKSRLGYVHRRAYNQQDHEITVYIVEVP